MRAKRPSAAVERAVAPHTHAEFAGSYIPSHLYHRQHRTCVPTSMVIAYTCITTLTDLTSTLFFILKNGSPVVTISSQPQPSQIFTPLPYLWTSRRKSGETQHIMYLCPRLYYQSNLHKLIETYKY